MKKRPRGAQPARGRTEEITRQLRVTNVLLAALLLQDMRQIDAIDVLRRTDLTNEEIAALLGTSSAVVAVTAGRIRKRQTKGDARVEDQSHTASEAAPETDLREAGD